MHIRIFSVLVIAFITFSTNAACPSKRVLLQQVKKERAELVDKNSKLKLLLQGNWTGPDAADLFVTALGSGDDQKLRVAELSKNLKVAPYRPTGYSEMFSCLDRFGMQDIADDLSTQAQSLDQARLIFLRLPVQVQQILTDPSRQVGNAYEDVRTIQDRIAAVEETLPPLAQQELALLTEMLKRAKDDLIATSELKSLTREVRAKNAGDNAFARANALWRHLVDDTFHTFRAPEMNFPEDHEHPGREESLKNEAEQWLQRGIERHYLLLVEAGKLRSELARNGGKKQWKLSDWEDIKREIKIVPYRFTGIFYSKAVDIRQKLRLGFAGIGPLARDAFFLLLLLLVPFILKNAFDRVSEWLDNYRTSILHTRNPGTFAKASAIWIQRLRPFLSWIFWYIALSIGENLLKGTVLEELALLFPYFKYFVLYRIFRRTIMLFLTGLSGHGGISFSRELKLKAANTARGVGLFALLSFTILHAVESIVSRGLIYEILVMIIQFLAFLLGLYWATRWNAETAAATRGHLSGRALELFDKVDGLLPRFIKAIPWLATALVVEVISFIQTLGSDFDLSKRLSAQVFRRQLESSEELSEGEEDNRLPKAYRELFPRGVATDENLIIEPENGALIKVIKEIDEWKNEESEEHSVAIYGDKGSGKSTILNEIAKHYADIRVVSADVPSKLLTREDALKFFGNLFGGELSEGGRDLIELDQSMEPTIVLLDEAQNLFLSRVGGFEGYKTLLDLIGTRTNNIFWVASFNRYSWAFLNAVFGRNQHFRTILRVQPWRDDDIKKLIMTRHKRGDWRLSFDAILQAVGGAKVEDAAAAIEAKFFKLLWEQSGGNPRAAQVLWLSSLSRMRGKMLRVGLPDDPELRILKDVSDDGLFVYAALVRHENLSTAEAAHVTDLPEGTVRYALRLGLENEFLYRSKNGRYRVLADAQRSLVAHLRKRNFIYGG